jgi:hypothetical protein
MNAKTNIVSRQEEMGFWLSRVVGGWYYLQTVQHELDSWLVVTLIGMVVQTSYTLVYASKRVISLKQPNPCAVFECKVYFTYSS